MSMTSDEQPKSSHAGRLAAGAALGLLAIAAGAILWATRGPAWGGGCWRWGSPG